MPVSTSVADKYVNLGIGGATLFILLVVAILLLKFVANMQKNNATQMQQMLNVVKQSLKDIQKQEANNDNNKLDKLCDKIDELVTATSDNTKELIKNLLSNDKDQKALTNKIDMLLEIAIDNQRRLSRIDDRTYQCLGNPTLKKGDEN